jgi:hypothetical protein
MKPRRQKIEIMPTAREYNDLRKGTWVNDLGIEIVSVEPRHLVAQVKVRKELLSPNGFLHAGCVIRPGAALFQNSRCSRRTRSKSIGVSLI